MGEWKEIPAMRSRKVEKVLKGICACMSAFLLVQMCWMGGYAIAEALSGPVEQSKTDIHAEKFSYDVNDLERGKDAGAETDKVGQADLAKPEKRDDERQSEGTGTAAASETCEYVEPDILVYDGEGASWCEEMPYDWNESDLGSVPQEDAADQSGLSEMGSYSSSDLQFRGVINDGGREYTWYSENVLPGDGLDIPGRHVDEEGFVVDEDGYIAIASPWGADAVGTEIDTPFGPAKVYDVCEDDSYDIYTSW